MRTASWLRVAGLQSIRARTVVGEAQAPLSQEMRAALEVLLEMRWGDACKDLGPEDRAAYERLCRVDSPDCILSLPDYYAFFTYSMFLGSVPGQARR